MLKKFRFSIYQRDESISLYLDLDRYHSLPPLKEIYQAETSQDLRNWDTL